MPDLDIEEIATRKLGPLPTWGWGIAIVGAVVAFKLLGGGSKTTGSIGQTPIPNVGTDTTGGITNDGGVFSGPSSLVDTLQSSVTELQTEVGKLTTFQQLQLKLTDALTGRTTLLTQQSAAKTALAKHQAGLKSCTTAACKTRNKAWIAQDQALLASLATKIADINKIIADLQAQMKGTA